MITDQVVAILASEGYRRDSVRIAMNSLAEEDWRDEDDDWSEGDLRTLRRHLGTPPVSSLDEHPADAHDPRYSTEVWAADLARVFERTTGGDVPLSRDQIRQVAHHLLHQSSGLWDTQSESSRIDDVSDYTVDRWADGINEALQAATDGRIEVSRVELQVAANILLHAQEDGWVSQAALLEAEHRGRPSETP